MVVVRSNKATYRARILITCYTPVARVKYAEKCEKKGASGGRNARMHGDTSRLQMGIGTKGEIGKHGVVA